MLGGADCPPESAMRHLYSALLYALLPLVLLRMLWRSRRISEYRQRIGERFGVFDSRTASTFADGRPAIWVHAVSVGEVRAAAPLLEHLLLEYPDFRLVVTTTTPTGSQRVQALFGERVCHAYAPWDLPGSVCRFLDHTRPRLLVLMETELWPNLLHYCRARDCRIVLANARLSQRSAAGYARFPGLARTMLTQLDLVACQFASDGERFLSLGLAPQKLQLIGSIKFDVQLDAAAQTRAAALRGQLGADSRDILLAASTHPGEEEHLLAALRELRHAGNSCLLVLAPRHPERCTEVHARCLSAGWRVVRYSGSTAYSSSDDILLVDSIGELPVLFGAASVAFIGGSLVPHGGHNAVEAAVWGVPVVSGPHMENFAGVCALLVDAGAMIMLADARPLAVTLARLLADQPRRQAMGIAGKRVVAENRGAQRTLLELVGRQLRDG
jgi:3-deoxy-D-manno-octulosonic-acid transferase